MTKRLLLLLPVAAALALVIALAVLRPPGPPSKPHRFAMGKGPVIVLLHGAGSSIQDWLPTARRLADRHRVVLVELPGHGLSPLPEPLTLERAAEALHLALEAESKEPVVLVGHAAGGLVAAVEALEHPERVRALVLVETALRPRLEGEERRRMLEAIDLDYPGALREIFAACGRDSAQGARLGAYASKVGPSTLKPWLRLELFADISLRMRHLKPPLLAILGERSWPADQSWPAVSRRLGYPDEPQARTERLEDCGRFPMLDRPEDLARLIGHFADDSVRGPVAAR